MVDKMALGLVSLRVLRFCPASHHFQSLIAFETSIKVSNVEG
jgi:hypothetical protein